MAEDLDVAQLADASLLDRLPMRNENGEIRHEFVEAISHAIHDANTSSLRAIVAELHEADLGDLIAALEPDDRVTLVELTGADFDFSAINHRMPPLFQSNSIPVCCPNSTLRLRFAVLLNPRHQQLRHPLRPIPVHQCLSALCHLERELRILQELPDSTLNLFIRNIREQP